jgi:pimeloyl-ACP methyl ester carboxylesterase
MADDEIRPYRIAVPDADLLDLHDRLDRTRWPDELPDVGWDYGIPMGYLKELADYWRNEYDWRRAEAGLNEWPQFSTTIDGANIHFAHVRSTETDAQALIMTHGWPGSIAEFLRVAGPLTDPAAHGAPGAPAFHLVLPSIPGYGLSGPTHDTGWEFQRTAVAWAELMRRLGYDRYAAQGGDWGAIISRELGRIRPDQVIGVHLNMMPGATPASEPTAADLADLSPDERERIVQAWERQRVWTREGQGYSGIQSTKPQTLAYALTDSPVGQLAWIVEKFKEWTDSRDRPEDAVDRDQMLTNVMLYWLTGTAGSSARFYYERAHASARGAMLAASPTPTAVADFAHEIYRPLPHLARRANNIVRWSRFERGGHFAAMEQPELLVDDIRAFFATLATD